MRPRNAGPPVKNGVLDLLKDLATIAGAGAVLLTAEGFLVLRAHAAVLGLSSVLHHSVAEYADEGGAFLLTTLLWAIPSLALSYPLFWIGTGLMAFFFYLQRKPTLWRRLLGWLTLNRRVKEAWLQFLLVIASALLASYAIARLLPSPQAEDLLFATGNQGEIELRATEEGMLLLETDYLGGLLTALLSGILIFFAWKSLSPRSGGLATPGRLLLVTLVLVQALLLPVRYGQTVYSNAFHRVDRLVVTTEVQAKLPQSDQVWLLSRSSDHFVFYFRDSYSVSLIGKDSVLELALAERRNVFAPAAP